MELNDYQRAAARTAKYPKEMGLYYTGLGLAGEAGEVANKIKKLIRDHEGKQPTIGQAMAIADELGDVLWYVAMLAQSLGYDLNTIATKNIDKLAGREAAGTISGEGDSR